MKFRLGAQFGNIINHPQYIPGSNPGFGLGVNDVNGFSTVTTGYDSFVNPGNANFTFRRAYSPATLEPWPSWQSSAFNLLFR